jgi:hypothetical protein
VLEALLKRVDGLERRLKDEKKSHSPSNESGPIAHDDSSNGDTVQQLQLDTNISNAVEESAVYSPTPTRQAATLSTNGKDANKSSVPSPTILPDVLLDTYFMRVHGKVYHILDETIIRQRLQMNQVPNHLLYAIYAVSARFVVMFALEVQILNSSRYTAHPNGYHAAVRLSEDYVIRARAELDIDDPTIDNLQTLLLLSVAFVAAGKGKKAYMLLCKLRMAY